MRPIVFSYEQQGAIYAAYWELNNGFLIVKQCKILQGGSMYSGELNTLATKGPTSGLFPTRTEKHPDLILSGQIVIRECTDEAIENWNSFERDNGTEAGREL